MADKPKPNVSVGRCRAWGGGLDRWNQWEFYQDRGGKWRWRVKAEENGLVIGCSSQGYTRRVDCFENAKRVGYGGADPWKVQQP